MPATSPILRWLALIALSAILTVAMERLNLPAALLLGPMAAGIAMAVSGAGLRIPTPAMQVSQGLVGLMIATLLPPSLLVEVMARWPVVVLGTLSTIVASTALGWIMARSGLLPGTTAIWGSAPGGASVMTMLSQHYGADMRLVAFMQYLRVACVAVAATLVARLWGVHGAPPAVIWFPDMPPVEVAATIALAAALAFGGKWLRLPGGSFLLPIFGGIAVVHLTALPIRLPPWLLALSYACIGWLIGLSFTTDILRHAARAFPRALGSTLLLMAICAGMAGLLVAFAGLDPLTAYLATSPGGADSVAIISASTQVDVPFVMAMQMSRLLLVVLMGPWLARLLSSRR